MKSFLLGLLAVSSSFSFAADEIMATQQGHAVRVNSVSTEIVGEQGFPSTVVRVKATFGNDCQVPKSDDLLVVQQHSKDFSQLNITLAEIPTLKACPAVYQPVTVTLNLGEYTKPNDGLFSQITVNGVKAARQF